MSIAGKSFQGQSGVSLVELLIVVAIISVVASLAMMQRGSANEQFQRQNAARELKVAFERARFDSVKRRADGTVPQAYVEVTSASFTLRVDRNQDGVLDSSDDHITSVPTNIVIAGSGISLPTTVIYDQRGEVGVVGGGNPIFLVCNVDCSSPGNDDANIVLVTPTGTVNLLAGGSSIPSFSAPVGITVVPPGTEINNSAVVTPAP